MEHIPRVGTAYIGCAASRQLTSGPEDPERAAAYQKEVQRLVDAWRPKVEVSSGEEFEEWSIIDFVAVGSRRHVVKLRVQTQWKKFRPPTEEEEEYPCIHLRIESGAAGKRASCGFALEKGLEDPLEDDEDEFEPTDNWRSWLTAPLRLLTGVSQCGPLPHPSSCQIQEGVAGEVKSRFRGEKLNF